jgi:hypothetical protein
MPCHRINKLDTPAHHRDRSAAAAIFANGTYFLDNPRIYEIQILPHLLNASTVMEKHNATRNTAFTSAPKTSARAQPNVFFDHFFGDIYKDKTEYTHMHPNKHEQVRVYTHR